MRSYLVRRVLQYALVLFGAIVINFALPRMAPGSVVDFLVPPAEAGSLTPEQRQEILDEFDLGGSIPEQFITYVSGLARGRLGVSVIYARPVEDLLFERLPWTLLLVGTALVLSVAIGTALGFMSGWRRGTRGDAGILAGVMFVQSMPAFFVAMLLVLTFSVQLGWFPVYGAVLTTADGWAQIWSIAQRLVMPLIALTAASVGGIYLVARPAIVAEMREDYVVMAAAKGLGARAVRRHAQRNAFIPISTVALIGLGDIVGGATVIETVFAYPGIGRLIFESVIRRDYPVLQGAFFLLAVTVILANLLADLLYPILDPRVRRAGPDREGSGRPN